MASKLPNQATLIPNNLVSYVLLLRVYPTINVAMGLRFSLLVSVFQLPRLALCVLPGSSWPDQPPVVALIPFRSTMSCHTCTLC
jgi:hypothetical protein